MRIDEDDPNQPRYFFSLACIWRSRLLGGALPSRGSPPVPTKAKTCLRFGPNPPLPVPVALPPLPLLTAGSFMNGMAGGRKGDVIRARNVIAKMPLEFNERWSLKITNGALSMRSNNKGMMNLSTIGCAGAANKSVDYMMLSAQSRREGRHAMNALVSRCALIRNASLSVGTTCIASQVRK